MLRYKFFQAFDELMQVGIVLGCAIVECRGQRHHPKTMEGCCLKSMGMGLSLALLVMVFGGRCFDWKEHD